MNEKVMYGLSLIEDKQTRIKIIDIVKDIKTKVLENGTYTFTFKDYVPEQMIYQNLTEEEKRTFLSCYCSHGAIIFSLVIDILRDDGFKLNISIDDENTFLFDQQITVSALKFRDGIYLHCCGDITHISLDTLNKMLK